MRPANIQKTHAYRKADKHGTRGLRRIYLAGTNFIAAEFMQ